MGNPNQTLYDALRSLDSTGENGFEGLIAKLLESLIVKRFFLATGYQGGQDMSTEGRNANAIAVECKRYRKNTALKKRELLGELEEITWDIPVLDLWVLVTSRKVSAQLARAIVRSAQEKGFEAFIIDTIESDSGPPSSLATLCAHHPDFVLQFLQKKNPNLNTASIQNVLTAITQQPGYHDVLQRLHRELSSPSIGYDNCRHSQNSWLLGKFRSERKSRAAFNQVVNVLDTSAWNVERKTINATLDNWLQDTWQKKQAFIALLGEQGDGKTWAIASWLAQKLNTDKNFPAVLFLTSNALPSTTEPQELLAQSIVRQLREFDAQYWEKRILKWMQRTPGDVPQIILVLDGVNERHDFDWRSLLEKLDASPWKRQIGVILTCRNIPWKDNYASLSHLPVQLLTIPPFSDDELTAALSLHKMTLSDIHPSLLPLIRKPRYLDLTIQHYQVMVESGDPTVQRLIYEDWKDRFRRKSGIKLTHEQFHELIKVLAEKTLSGSRSFSQRDVENLLPSDARQVVYELISGGILIPDPVRKVSYVVEPRRLVHGFGLLLKQEIHDALLSNLPEEECIAKLIDPDRDMDLKVKIYGAAVVHAIMDDDYPEEGKDILFQLWVESRNLNEEAQSDIIA